MALRPASFFLIIKRIIEFYMQKFDLIINNKKIGYICGPEAINLQAAAPLLASNTLPEGWSWVKSSEHTIVAKNSLNKNDNQVFFKIFLNRNYLENVKAFFRGSRCRRSLKQSDVLLNHGFRTPGVNCWGKCLGVDFIVTQAIAGVGYGDYIKSLEKLFNKQSELKDLTTLIYNKRSLVSALGSQVGLLHRAGIIHGDLRPNNILIKDEQATPEFYFIDNERNQLYKQPSMRLIIKNLVQIMMFFPEQLSFTYRQRFYKNYFKAVNRFDLVEQKKIIRLVYQKVNQRLEGKPRE